MSTVPPTRRCSSCKRNRLPSFFDNPNNSTHPFKTCDDCRSRRRIRQSRSARDLSTPNLNIAGPSRDADVDRPQLQAEEILRISTNLVNNESTTLLPLTHCNSCRRDLPSHDFTDPFTEITYRQCSNCRHRDYLRRHPQAEETILTTTNPDNMLRCTKCKRNCPRNLFINLDSSILFATCSDCRLRTRQQRYPFARLPANQIIPEPEATTNDDDNDNEIANLVADIGQFEIEEPVIPNGPIPDDCPMDNEPIYISSQRQSREFRARSEQLRQIAEADEEEVAVIPGVVGIEEVNVPEIQINEPTRVVVPPIPTRLPSWRIARPNRTVDPAGYKSKYRPNMRAHDLGERNSVCPSCGALHFAAERVSSSSIRAPRFQTCCKEGQVVLEDIREPPEGIKRLLVGEDSRSKRFREKIRNYNSAFAFTSFNWTPDQRLDNMGQRGGIRSFTIHGATYHQIGAVPRPNAPRKYAQLYFLDPDQANQERVEQRGLDRGIVEELSAMIAQYNPFYNYYKTAQESIQDTSHEHVENRGNLEARVIIDANYRLILEQGADRRRENLPTANEFAVLMPDGADNNQLEVILFVRNADGALSTRFHTIHRGHPAYLPLHYVIFFIFGNPGYRWNIPLVRRGSRVLGNDDEGEGEGVEEGGSTGHVSARQYYRYHIFSRVGKFNPLIHGERLFQQLLCDMYACVDDNILEWHENNQHIIRSDLYRGVVDALRSDDPVRQIGVPVILPASYHGGDRHMTRCYQNAMAITRALGKPSLFITFTANPRWPEVLRNLEHGQTPDKRPDLIVIVFFCKFIALLHDLTKRQIFGKCIGVVFSVEYQKRGLPHTHILIFLQEDDVPKSAEDVDQIVCAEVMGIDEELDEVIKSTMIHGPCGPGFPNAPCMRDGKCTKGYPKRWCEETELTDGSYPEYKRPQGGPTWESTNFTFDNRWVVPYNPYLSKKYRAHINVEVAKGVHAIKYLAKYVYKGTDRATLAVEDRYNEIAMTLQARYISCTEAVYRLMEYPTHREKPAVMLLPFHLEGDHIVTFPANLTRVQLGLVADSQTSIFLAWMECNRRLPDARQLTYSDFPTFYTYDRRRGRWSPRRSGVTIGRMPIVNPGQGERFYLRLLLTVQRGPRSYSELYTVNGTIYASPKPACLALGLIADDSEWTHFFSQIIDTATAHNLRSTLASIITHSTITNPQALWDRFRDNLTDDCLYHLRNLDNLINPPPADWSEEQCRYDYGLWLLGEQLRGEGKDWGFANMAGPIHNWEATQLESNPLIREQLDYPREELRQHFDNALSTFNPGQRQAFEVITNTIDTNQKPNTFFLNGPAGTGKTFLYSVLCSYYRSQGKIVLCVASSGIASILLPGGRTSHSMFKIPINSDEDTQCRVAGNSQLAKLLRRTHLIIWDEVTLQNKYDFAAVDKCLRSLLNNSDLFGGIPVVLGGDFAQILPVVVRGRRADIVNACIRSWSEWPKVRPLFLTQNMRIVDGETNQRFAAWLARLPYDESLNGTIDLPEFIQTTDDKKAFREFIYPEDDLRAGEVNIFNDRAILSSRNDAVDVFNADIADIRGSESREYIARDQVQNVQEEQNTDHTPEYLQTISGPSFPPGKLTLQVGMPVMLLRNVHPREGLCNGTRLIITRLYDHGVRGRIISTVPNFHGQEHYIHRINLTETKNLTFTLLRTQLPLRPCFSMTINKSQGQTLQRVGVDLSTGVFTHGQLYVALSRVTNVDRLIVLLPQGTRQTKNIVYPEVLLRPETHENENNRGNEVV